MRTQRVRRSAGNRASAKPPARPRARLQPKTKTLATAGAVALLVGLGSATTLGEARLGAAIAGAQERIDAISGRSPGARTEANMTKGKPRALARALPGVRDARGSVAAPLIGSVPAPVAGFLSPPGGVAAPVIGGLLPAENVIGGFLPGGALPIGGVFVGGPGGFLGGGGIGGGGGGGGVAILPPGEAGTGPAEETPPAIVVVTPPTPAPIPEPGRWALMILGFGLVGATLRQRPQKLSCPSRAQA